MIYVITAVHNRLNITKRFVEEIKNQTLKSIRLILVDDGSTDGTSEMVKSLLPDSIILKGNGKLWWGGALHRAYQYIKKELLDDDYIFIANDDTYFSNDFIERAISVLDDNSHQQVLLVGSGIGKQSNRVLDGAVNFDYSVCRARVVDFNNGVAYGNCASTRNIFFKVKDFRTIGGFHPVLLPHYYSDYEWTIRAHEKKGYRIMCVESLKYELNELTTSDRKEGKRSLKKLMSKRSPSNPFYKVMFILLAIPARKKAYSLFYQSKLMLKKKTNA